MWMKIQVFKLFAEELINYNFIMRVYFAWPEKL